MATAGDTGADRGVGTASGQPAQGSGGNEGDKAPRPGTAEQIMGRPDIPPASLQPPRVTLTIELGSLTPEVIKAVTQFVDSALHCGAGLGAAAAVSKHDQPK